MKENLLAILRIYRSSGYSANNVYKVNLKNARSARAGDASSKAHESRISAGLRRDVDRLRKSRDSPLHEMHILNIADQNFIESRARLDGGKVKFHICSSQKAEGTSFLYFFQN